MISVRNAGYGSQNNKCAPNGTEWTKSLMTTGANAVHNDNGIWVCASDNGIYYSEDGYSWSLSNINEGTFFSIYYIKGIWIVSSNKSNASGIYYSSDGKNWNKTKLDIPYFNKIVYGKDRMFAISDDSLYVSLDGMSWSTSSKLTGINFKDIYYSDGLWMIAPRYSNGLYYSTDGYSWTKLFDDTTFNGVFCANGKWVSWSTSKNMPYYSVSGSSNWRVGNKVGAISFEKVDYINGTYYGLTDNDMCYSAEGENWLPCDIPINQFYPKSFYYANGIFVAGSTNAVYPGIYNSTNGVSWVKCSNKETYGKFYYNNGTWIGLDNTPYGGLAYSKDAETWTYIDFNSACNDVLYANGMWVLCTSSGIFYSEGLQPSI
ncbi:WD40/YVTN/BNR-like repeat-containing protein [Ihubacter sp. rT4E-8]|uniref:WD40/YVTN/BNR-like repeat-containing protein n=1 Tax=Ihubacter sp. rT4E-8 TaxID=3242369 RepID=UPI003CE82FA7